ncbi:glycosyltransferase family 2 protein [Streptantibioticus rubrisoli]|uniref:Glycosyltransferase n=1 Tax=Streptantibioticus rubrisoli TaxID=1387313 RepID=A0ABT1PEJ6_9ACTN|nr:glycosyltransferase [Streptantibioticus rubrisoli]MCQ4043776.1 glycosyltransferase [Streptantibioticus rubrisoli]
MSESELPYAVVIPTIGRPSLNVCLAALADSVGPPPRQVVIADDRPLTDCHPLPVTIPMALRDRVEIVASCGNGPAAARNAGWSATTQPWVVFLDDDTLPGAHWARELARDLIGATPRTGGVQGRIRVPLPRDRAPTDWERCTGSLATARWITADMAYRRQALEAVGGFDERFRRAFREDADLALRVEDAGWTLVVGCRETEHPVRQTDRWMSVRAQAGNADDVLMTRLHGRGWWRRAGAGRGRLPVHLAVTGAGVAAAVCVAGRRPRTAGALAAVWLAGTTELALTRILRGPRTAREVTDMLLTSALIPPAACGHWLRGWWRHRGVRPWRAASPGGASSTGTAACTRQPVDRQRVRG